MDNLKKVMEKAISKFETKKELADYLNITNTNLSSILAGKRGLSDFAQIKLELLLNLKTGSLRAISAAVTEVDPDKKTFWSKVAKIEAAAWEIADTEINIQNTRKAINKIMPKRKK